MTIVILKILFKAVNGFGPSMEGSSLALFCVRLEMLKDRGYAVPDSEIYLSLQEFRAIHGQSPDLDRLRLSVTHKTDPSERMLVVFYGPGMVKVNGIRFITGIITNKESLTGLILILQNHITNQALKALDLYSFKVEIFQKDSIAKYYGFEKGQVIKVTYGEITESDVLTNASGDAVM